MKKLLVLVMISFPAFCSAQSGDSLNSISYKPEILTSGFVDVLNNGQVNASARFIRLFIGEPGKFTLPLSIYSGVSANNFQNQLTSGGQRSNEQLAIALINPLAGIINVALDGIIFFRRRISKLTGTAFLYHAGSRLVTGYRTGNLLDPSTGRPVNFLNSVGYGGMYIQTGAWDKNNSKNVGICWIAGRYIISKSSSSQLENFLPDIQTNGFYHGWSAGWGVEINNLINIKVIYYKYEKAPEMDFASPIYQFSFTYSMR